MFCYSLLPDAVNSCFLSPHYPDAINSCFVTRHYPDAASSFVIYMYLPLYSFIVNVVLKEYFKGTFYSEPS